MFFGNTDRQYILRSFSNIDAQLLSFGQDKDLKTLDTSVFQFYSKCNCWCVVYIEICRELYQQQVYPRGTFQLGTDGGVEMSKTWTFKFEYFTSWHFSSNFFFRKQTWIKDSWCLKSRILLIFLTEWYLFWYFI